MKIIEKFTNSLNGSDSIASTIITNLCFLILFSLGLFLSNITFVPYVAKYYLFPKMIGDGKVHESLMIAVYSLSSSIPSGLIFGFVAGLWGSFKSLKAIFLLGISVIILLTIQEYLSLNSVDSTFGKYQFYWIVKFVEAIVFIGVFAIVTVSVNKISAHNSSTTLKRVVCISILIVFFWMLNVNMLFS